MYEFKNKSSRCGATVATRVSVLALLATGSLAASTASAQTGPTNLVSVCSGVSLPPSAVTATLTPVASGIVTPLQDRSNVLLGVLGGVLPLTPPLSVDVAGLLANAAAGAPVTLQAVNVNGLVVGPTDRCDARADSVVLTTPAGVSIGGNRVTGLGATGQEASAGSIDAIAIGNTAATDAGAGAAIAIGQGATVGAGATGSLALGAGATASGANGVALGAGSIAARGPAAGSAGEVSIGAPGAERQITNVAAGTAPTDAANLGQVQGVAGQVAALNDRAVQYDTAARDVVTLAGAGGTRLTNVTPGALTATSTDAVNGAQLFATNAQVGTNTTAITTLSTNVSNGAVGPVRYSDAGTPATPNGGTPTNDLTLVGAAAGPVGLHNVAAGVAVTDAANVGQVQAVQGQVAALGTRAVVYDGAAQDRVTLAGAVGTTLGNVAAGAVTAGSTEAVNGGQLFATNAQVTANTTAITNLTTGAAGPLRYSDATTPTTPNGGTPTNDVTLVGGGAGPVAVHNVANGAIASGSTDAVNGGQIYGLALTAVNAVAYDTNTAGARTNTVTLAGGTAAAPVRVTNVAGGTVAAGSSDAVNGAQLAATNQAVATVQVQSANSVQYDTGRTAVTLNPGNAPTAIRNVAAGTSATDAVNVGQFTSGLGTTLTQANTYTDQRLAAVNYDLRQVRRDSYAGTAGALAAAGLPQAYEAGKGMIAIAGGTYRDATAVAIGISKAFDDGHTVVKFAGTYDSRSRAGASGGVGYQF